MTDPMQTNVLYYGDNLDILRRLGPDPLRNLQPGACTRNQRY